jgi:hypothetical protein
MFARCSFYPGIASSGNDLPSIGTGWTPGALSHPQRASQDSPEVDEAVDPESEELPFTPLGVAVADADINKSYGNELAARVVTSPIAAARAPRVTGSFDHALLPMPPVSSLFAWVFFKIHEA